ncbi:hypothetical protein IOCL2690_000669600 [Leishmania lindenbergi]|uniref:Uncharacterized protein n=1 Tax=Leishmania lindenbergi TaxID=651832 RepID=A0AAW3A0W6_9TRYP
MLGPSDSERAAQMFEGASGADAAEVSRLSASTDTVGAVYSGVFTSAASATDVLVHGLTSDGAIAMA